MRVSPALGMCAVRWSSRAIALKGQGARLKSLRRIAELFEREREASDFAKGFVDEDDCGYRRTKLLTKGHAGH